MSATKQDSFAKLLDCYSVKMHISPPRILCIGTCRIFRPLRHMDAAGKIELLHYGKTPHWWFTHSSGEALQYVRAISGDIDIRPDLRHLACETTNELPLDLSAPQSLQKIDLVVVELSTFKKLELQGVRLNFQNVWGYANRAGVSTRDVLSGGSVEWPDGIAPLTGLTVAKSDTQEVMSDLLEIRASLNTPMLTVDHLYALTNSGEPVPGRNLITGALSAFQEQHNVPFHSTRPLLEKHGNTIALADENHYRNDFEVTVGEDLMTSIQRALSYS